MNYTFKVLFMALLSTIILSVTFGQRRIELHLDPQGILINPPTENLSAGEWVIWTIGRGQRIADFRIAGNSDPFTVRLDGYRTKLRDERY